MVKEVFFGGRPYWGQHKMAGYLFGNPTELSQASCKYGVSMLDPPKFPVWSTLTISVIVLTSLPYILPARNKGNPV